MSRQRITCPTCGAGFDEWLAITTTDRGWIACSLYCAVLLDERDELAQWWALPTPRPPLPPSVQRQLLEAHHVVALP